MPKVALYNQTGATLGDFDLADAVFAVEPNQQVIYDVVKAIRAGMRQGTHSTKTRRYVSGGGRKPYRQKGTGNARQGSIRAPQWVGGGIVFGPNPHKHGVKVNRKVRRLAMRIALSDKVRLAKFIVLDQIALETFKTKSALEVLNNVKAEGKILVLLDDFNDNVDIATRNLPNVFTTLYEHASVYDILNATTIVTTVAAAKKIEEGLLE